MILISSFFKLNFGKRRGFPTDDGTDTCSLRRRIIRGQSRAVVDASLRDDEPWQSEGRADTRLAKPLQSATEMDLRPQVA